MSSEEEGDVTSVTSCSANEKRHRFKSNKSRKRSQKSKTRSRSDNNREDMRYLVDTSNVRLVLEEKALLERQVLEYKNTLLNQSQLISSLQNQQN